MPEIFGWQHIVYLIVAVAIGVASIILIKKYCKSERSLSIAIRSYSALLFVWILANRILIAVRDGPHGFIPTTFCGFTSLCYAILGMTVKKNSGPLHWVSYCAFLGGILTMIYPDFIGQAASIFYPLTITGLVHHTVMFFLCVLMIATGWLKPTMKKWAWLPLGLTCMMTYGLLMINAFGYSDAMYINEALIEGSIFTWYFTGFIFLALHLCFLLACEAVYKKRGEDNFYDSLKETFDKLKNFKVA